MRILTREGVTFRSVESDEEASRVGTYWNAVRKYVDTGDESDLFEFEGEQVAGEFLEVDPDWIDFWALRGELEFEDIYE